MSHVRSMLPEPHYSTIAQNWLEQHTRNVQVPSSNLGRRSIFYTGECLMTQAGDQEFDENDDDEDIIRAKWSFDGARTLLEAATMLREYANELDQMHNDGWELT